MTTPLPDFAKANCIGTDTESFYPEDSSSVMRTASRVCQNCEIINECAEYAIKHEAHGVWGGMLPTHRREYRKKHNIVLEQIDWSDHVIRNAMVFKK